MVAGLSFSLLHHRLTALLKEFFDGLYSVILLPAVHRQHLSSHLTVYTLTKITMYVVDGP